MGCQVFCQVKAPVGTVDAGVPMFATQLHEREAFRAIFSYRQTLENLDPRDVSNLDKAITNAEQFTVEVIERLRGRPVSAPDEKAAETTIAEETA